MVPSGSGDWWLLILWGQWQQARVVLLLSPPSAWGGEISLSLLSNFTRYSHAVESPVSREAEAPLPVTFG